MQCFIHVKSISRKKFGSSNSEISAFCTSKEYDNVTTPNHPFSLYSLIWQVVTYGRLKTKENFKLLALKSGRGRLRYLHILQKYQDIFAMTYKVLCLTASSSITKHKIFITRAQIGSMLGMILLTYLSVLTYFREIVYI